MSRKLDELTTSLAATLAAAPSRPVVEHPSRAALLDEFEELASRLDGVVGRRIYGGGITIGYAGRCLVLFPEGPADLRVAYANCGEERLTRDPTGRWMWVGREGRALLNERAVHDMFVVALDLPDEQETATGALTERTAPKGPRDGEPAHMGRSGTRGVKRSSDLPPGSVVKDIKGPLG